MAKINPTTLFIGQKSLYLPSCQSTNDVAYETIRSNSLMDGYLIWTMNQTAGRGQRGNSWEAVQGQNLTFSLVLQPKFLQIQEQFMLSMAISLALYDFTAKHLPSHQVKIKWPNDLYVNEQKIAGILIENQIRGSQWTYAIVGIGFNINQATFVHPKATSLGLLAEREYELAEVLEEMLGFIEARYLQLRNQTGSLKQSYHQHLYQKDSWHWFRHLKTAVPYEFFGSIQGVNALGHLQVLKEDGQVEAFGFKEIGVL